MCEYYLTPIKDNNNPKFKFYLLYQNGRNFYEEFVASLDQQSDLDELSKIKAMMDMVGNNNLPRTKYGHIYGGKKDRKDVFEFKSKHLRIYVIKKEPDIYVVLGGYKKTQGDDVAKVFRHFNSIPDEIEIKEDENV